MFRLRLGACRPGVARPRPRDGPPNGATSLPAARLRHLCKTELGRHNGRHLCRGPDPAAVRWARQPRPQHLKDGRRQDRGLRAVAASLVARADNGPNWVSRASSCSTRAAPSSSAARPPRRSAPAPAARSPGQAAPASPPCCPNSPPATPPGSDVPPPRPCPPPLVIGEEDKPSKSRRESRLARLNQPEPVSLPMLLGLLLDGRIT